MTGAGPGSAVAKIANSFLEAAELDSEVGKRREAQGPVYDAEKRASPETLLTNVRLACTLAQAT
jgi:hypothetical protein